jgi:cell wall-associated NlpC family hydrolase
VAKAKESEASKLAQIKEISGLLDGLRATAEAATKTSLIAAEAYRVTQDKLDAATKREADLTAQAKAAQAAAETSKMRAGLIAAHLAKTGAQDLTVKLFLNGSSADDLLQQLGTASKLSEQSATIYRTAVQDKNEATSLGEQAKAATAERTRLAAESKSTFDTANKAAQASNAAFETEQKNSNELYEQLALLKDSTAAAERDFRAALDAKAAADALAEAEKNKPGVPPTNPNPSNPTPSNPNPSNPTPSNPNPSNPTPTNPNPPVVPQPDPVDPTPPVVTPPVVGEPNAGAVDTAIAFARQQIGDRYELGASGPDAWDCSGLTKVAYAQAGLYIGTHSATNQYYEMAAQGKLLPFSQAQVGDLVFWEGRPGDFYHVALYMGGGQILEAPDYGKPVRIHSIWSWGDVAAYVGRPTG